MGCKNSIKALTNLMDKRWSSNNWKKKQSRWKTTHFPSDHILKKERQGMRTFQIPWTALKIINIFDGRKIVRQEPKNMIFFKKQSIFREIVINYETKGMSTFIILRSVKTTKSIKKSDGQKIVTQKPENNIFFWKRVFGQKCDHWIF